MTGIRARMKGSQMRRDRQSQAHTRDSYRSPKRSSGDSRCPVLVLVAVKSIFMRRAGGGLRDFGGIGKSRAKICAAGHRRHIRRDRGHR